MAGSTDRIQIVIRALDQTQDELNQARKNVRSLQKDINRLSKEVEQGNKGMQRELDRTTRAYTEESRAVGKLENEVTRIKGKIKEFKNEVTQSSRASVRAFDAVTRKLNVTGTSVDRLRIRLEKLDDNANAFRTKWSSAIDSVQRKMNGLHSKTSGLGGGMARTGLFAAGVAGAGLAGMGISTANQLEQTQIAYETMLGSAQKAQKMMMWLQETTMKTPFELQGLTTATQRLLAFGFTAKEARKNLITIGDAAAATGLQQEGIERVSLALGQMQGKQKIQSQEMRQLTEAGIPAWELLANKMHMTVAELQALSESKGGGAKIFEAGGLPKLLAAMNEKYGGLMAKQVNTLGGRWSNLLDTLKLRSARFLKETGMQEGLKNLMKDVTDGIGKAFDNLGKIVERVKPTIIAVFRFIIDNKVAFYAAAAAIGVMTAAILAFNAAMAINPVVLIVLAIGALIALLVMAYKKVGWFRDAVTAVWEWIRKATAWFVDWFKNYAWPVLKFVFAAIKLYLTKVLFPIWRIIFRALGKVISILWNYISKVWWPGVRYVFRFLIAFWRRTVAGARRVWDGAVSIFRDVKKRIGDIINGIKDFFKGLWNGLTEGLPAAINTMKQWLSKIPGLGAILDGLLFTGGPVAAGGTYLVGEIGPEMFVPNSGSPRMIGMHGPELLESSTSGYVIPNHLLAAVTVGEPRGGTATMTAAPSVTIQSMHVADEFDVEATMTRAMLRADRIARERR